jgi:membrane protease YdiL (CAAX protease family)
MWLAAGVLAAISSGTLIWFHMAAQPDARPLASRIPMRAMGGVWSAGLIFSVLNASFEEWTFRVVLYDAVKAWWGKWSALLATAVLFGAGHLAGYPPGIVGAVLAGFYGLALGWVRMETGGIGLPLAAHIVADATIFSILVRAGAFGQGWR